MVAVSMDCPHCLTQKVSFSGSQSMPCARNDDEYILLLQCACCFNGIIAKYRSKITFINWIQSNGQSQQPALIGVWPKAEPLSAPEHLPDNIRGFFFQGLDSLRRRSFDAAGTMFRKSLDVALKRVHPEGEGTLRKRIDSMPSEIGVTAAMKEWAHEIRELGNDAAHEEEPFTEVEAKVLHAFTELFLTYVFTLPTMLEERKKLKTAG